MRQYEKVVWVLVITCVVMLLMFSAATIFIDEFRREAVAMVGALFGGVVAIIGSLGLGGYITRELRKNGKGANNGEGNGGGRQ